MTQTIPVSIRLSLAEFERLEAIAARKKVTVRQLLQAHIRAGLNPSRIVRPIRKGQDRTYTAADIDRWVELAEAGLTNNQIAETAGVSKSLVSRYLIERGIRRHHRRTP